MKSKITLSFWSPERSRGAIESRRSYRAKALQDDSKTVGFTLIEILVAVTIIAVLTAIGLVSYGSANRNSRDAKRKSDIEQIRQALEMYRADNGFYPARNAGSWTNTQDYNLFGRDLITNGYSSAIPTDPQSPTQTYWYRATDNVGTTYYGYCLSAKLETTIPPPATCTPNGIQNYGVKNP